MYFCHRFWPIRLKFDSWVDICAPFHLKFGQDGKFLANFGMAVFNRIAAILANNDMTVV
jgi:hypothetical protein